MRGGALEPSLDFGKIPDHAAGREIEAPRKFAALFHLIDGGVGDRDDLAEFSGDGWFV